MTQYRIEGRTDLVKNGSLVENVDDKQYGAALARLQMQRVIVNYERLEKRVKELENKLNGCTRICANKISGDALT